MTMWADFTNKIRQAFSEAADQYDILAGLHREIGRELVQKIVPLPNVRCILDVGCGTGYLTNKVKFYFPESVVVGLDFSQGMLTKARGKYEDIAWVAADATQLPFKNETFDVVVSNLAYQWVGDLPRAFTEARRVLSPAGILALTLFGYHTCDELFTSLQAVTPGRQDIYRLPTIDQIRESLEMSGFLRPRVDYERILIQFKDLWDLLGWLKAIGANNLPGEFFVGKDVLGKADAYCRQHFPYHDGVRMTFEVIWVEAR